MKPIIIGLALLLAMAVPALAGGPMPESHPCGYYCTYNGHLTYCCVN